MPADFPDPLDRPDALPLGNSDDLISQLAGEEIARLLAPDANWQPEPPQAANAGELQPTPPPRKEETSVEELAAQLDQLFEEIRQATPPVAAPVASPAPTGAAKPSAKPKPPRRTAPAPRPPVAERVAAPTFEPYRAPEHSELEPPVAHFIDAEPVLVMRRRADEVEETIREEPRQTLIAPLEEDPLPPALRPLAWLNAPVADAGPRVRMLASAVSLLSFAASVSALIYVIVLRQQQM